jgi:hypothetical protein
MVDPAILAATLADAEQAYHQVMTTGGVVRLRHGDKWTEFGKANIGLLAGYIRDLKGQLGLTGARPRGRRVAF